MQTDWLREPRDRCVDEGVAYFSTQWGGHRPKAGGRLLDGRTWDQMPAKIERAISTGAAASDTPGAAG